MVPRIVRGLVRPAPLGFADVEDVALLPDGGPDCQRRSGSAHRPGRLRTVRARVAFGGVLRSAWAIDLAEGDEHTRIVGDDARGTALGAPRLRAGAHARRTDAYTTHYRTPLCRRFGRTRVDCEIQASRSDGSPPYRCDEIVELLLRRDGQIYRSRYRCPTRAHRGLFKVHPALLNESAVPLDLWT